MNSSRERFTSVRICSKLEWKKSGIAGKAFIHKPKCPKGRREVLDDFRADGNLNGLDGGKTTRL